MNFPALFLGINSDPDLLDVMAYIISQDSCRMLTANTPGEAIRVGTEEDDSPHFTQKPFSKDGLALKVLHVLNFA